MITRKLEAAWPSVSERLSAMLHRRGVSHHDADEAIQETAARVVSTGLEFRDADDLFRWAAVVSWRIAIDARRRCTRVTSHEVPDRADHVDVAQIAEHRMALSAVTTRFKDLSERDRAVLLASFDEQPTPNRVEQVRLAVARHRARSRLRSLLDGVAAPVAAFAARRWRWRTVRAEPYVVTAAPAVLFVAMSVSAFAGSTGVGPTPLPVVTARPVQAAAAEVPASSTSTSTVPAWSVTQAHTAVPTPSSPTDGSVRVHVAPGLSPYPTDAKVRDRQPSDHLACVTLPSLTGPSTTCVDPPTGVSP